MHKTFSEQENIGNAKYVVNFQNGVKTHRDGSPMFDIRIFSSKIKKEKFVQSLHAAGYTDRTLASDIAEDR